MTNLKVVRALLTALAAAALGSGLAAGPSAAQSEEIAIADAAAFGNSKTVQKTVAKSPRGCITRNYFPTADDQKRPFSKSTILRCQSTTVMIALAIRDSKGKWSLHGLQRVVNWDEEPNTPIEWNSLAFGGTCVPGNLYASAFKFAKHSGDTVGTYYRSPGKKLC